MNTPQPSPISLSDELDKILETSGIEFGVADNDERFDKAKSKAKAAITAAYAEAIRGCVPEKQHDLLEDSMGNEYRPMVQEGYNQAIDTMLDNLKKKGLLPDDPINQEKP